MSLYLYTLTSQDIDSNSKPVTHKSLSLSLSFNMGDNREPLINRNNNNDNSNNKNKFARSISHAQDELHIFRSYLRWMCVDQSNVWRASLSWSMFILFAIVVPAVSHFVLACSTCDSKHSRPYDTVVQLSLSSVATLSFVCLSTFVRKFGLRRFLFFDKLVDESETVRNGYTEQLNVSFPCFSQFLVCDFCFTLFRLTNLIFIPRIYMKTIFYSYMYICLYSCILCFSLLSSN